MSKICKICGSDSIPFGKRYFCSDECQNINDKQLAAAARERRLKKHPEKHTGQSSYLRLRFEILSRDNFTCQYCGRKAPDVILHIDHIQPLSKGGSSSKNNLTTACQECNYGKSDVLLKAHRLRNE